MKKILIIVFLLSANSAFALCAGPMLDPITRVRWNCFLPISIGGIPIGTSGNPLADMADRSMGTQSPVCLCMDPLPRIGITLGYREPIRIIESVKDPFCFPTLGFGMSSSAWGSGVKGRNSKPAKDFTNTHMFIFLPFTMMEIFTDLICMQTDSKYTGVLGGLSIAYMSEFDITKRSDQAALLLTPEVVLFANPLAIMACQIPDSIATLGEYTIPPLYWCAGNHSVFPTSNNTMSMSNFTEASEVNASKLIFSMHRTLQLWGSLGAQGLCSYYPMPIWNKMQYRLQTAMPVPDYFCRRLGQPSIVWNRFLNPPGAPNNDNMVFILWRKRDCCAF